MRTAAKIILIVWFSLAAGIELVQHGKQREGKHNFVLTFIGLAIEIILLTVGGFWTA